MPPKKEQSKKQEQIPEDDISGMPKQIVQFKWEFEVQQINLQNTAIMFEWFISSNTIERTDTGLIETWQPKSSDNQNILVFEKVYEPIKIIEDTVKQFCNRNFFIYLVNTDDMKIKQEILIDLSCLVTDRRENPEFIYENTKMKIIEIESFKFRLSADKILLQKEFREYLNPLEITIIGAKDLPVQQLKNYEPVYTSYEFFDGQVVQSPGIPHSNTIRWDYKHVHLLGGLDQAKLKELITTQIFKVQVHDKDELLDTSLKAEQELFDIKAWLKAEAEKDKPLEQEVPDPKKKGAKQDLKKEQPIVQKKEAPKKETKKKDVKIGEPIKEQEPLKQYNRNNYGLAGFSLCDLLKPNFRQSKLQATIVPRKKYEDLESANLELNTTARRNLPKKLASTNYMDSNTFLLIGIDISIGIGQYKQFITPIQIEPVIEQKDKKGQPIVVAQQQKHVEIQDETPVFERAVFIMPYKQREWVHKIQETFYNINMKCFPSEEGGIRALTTKALTEKEKKSKTLDFLTGFELLDSEVRMFVLEGLKNGGMKLLEEALPLENPNSETLKILKNSQILFKERMYTEFNVEIKRIRLRENLSKLLLKPDLYIRTKVPENIQDTLVNFSNILKQWNLRTVAQFNLFPLAVDLIAVERKYSDSLNDEDITGREISPKQKKRTQQSQIMTQNDQDKTQSGFQSQHPNIQSAGQRNITIAQDFSLNATNQHPQNTPKGALLLPTIKIKNATEHYDLQMKKLREPQYVQTSGLYSGQKNNDVELQVRALREKIRNDKNHFYTYSKDYLSLSVDPYDVNEVQKKEQLESIKLQGDRPNFRSVIPRPPQDFNKHPKKPPQCVIDDLKNEKHFEQQQLQQSALKPTKQLRAFSNNEKPEFIHHAGQIAIFSVPEVKQEEHMTATEREKQLREQRTKDQEEFLKKCLGPTFFYTKSRAFGSCDQIDKNKGMLEDKAIKKGLMVTNTQIKESNIQLTRRVNHPPSSIFHDDPYTLQVDPFTRKLDYDKAITNKLFDIYQEPEILTKTNVYKPLGKSQY